MLYEPDALVCNLLREFRVFLRRSVVNLAAARRPQRRQESPLYHFAVRVGIEEHVLVPRARLVLLRLVAAENRLSYRVPKTAFNVRIEYVRRLAGHGARRQSRKLYGILREFAYGLEVTAARVYSPAVYPDTQLLYLLA